VTSPPEPPAPGRPLDATAVDAAAVAAAGAVTLTRLEPGPARTAAAGDPGHALPDDDPLLVRVELSGALEGAITVAVGDELDQRLEYTAGADGPVSALAPVIEAVLGALDISVGAGGAIETAEPTEVGADAWPGDAETVTSVGLRDDDETVLALAFAVMVPPPPAPIDDAISGSGTSALSTSEGSARRSPPGGTDRSRGQGRARSSEATRLGAVEIDLAGVIGEAPITLHELLAWLPGVIVPLHRSVGMPVDVRIGDTVVGHAEVVVIDEHYGLRVVDVVAGVHARLRRGQIPGISQS
jgi:flagellar motor switch protein FliN